jgi:membrane protease YdiL (CAAX protease family)
MIRNVMSHPSSSEQERSTGLSVPDYAVPTSGPFIALVVAVAAGLTVGGWALITRTAIRSTLLNPVATATAGLLQPTLLVYAVFALVVSTLLWAQGFGPQTVGLHRRDVRVALVVGLAVWVVAQTASVVVALVTVGSVPPSATLVSDGAGTLLGLLIAQLFGNALYEEALYRGFLLTTLHARFVSSGRSRPFLAALVLSQTIFALVHVPSRLVDGVGGVSLATNLTLVLASGLVFALLYYRTRNLLLVVGVHALLNYPTVVLGSEAVASLVVATLSLVLLVAWPALERRFSVPQTERTVTPTEARPRF